MKRWAGERLNDLRAMAAFGLSMSDAAFFLGSTRSGIAGAADRNAIHFAHKDYGSPVDRLAARKLRRDAWVASLPAKVKPSRDAARNVLTGRQRDGDGYLMPVHPHDRRLGSR